MQRFNLLQLRFMPQGIGRSVMVITGQLYTSFQRSWDQKLRIGETTWMLAVPSAMLQTTIEQEKFGRLKSLKSSTRFVTFVRICSNGSELTIPTYFLMNSYGMEKPKVWIWTAAVPARSESSLGLQTSKLRKPHVARLR